MTSLKIGDIALASFENGVPPYLWQVTSYRFFMDLHLYTFSNITTKETVELSGNAVNAMQGKGYMIIYINNL